MNPLAFNAPHIPVLLQEVLDYLNAEKSGLYIDGTFGAGGYSRAILDHHPQTEVLALDRDPEAIRTGKHVADLYGSRLHLVQGCFAQMESFIHTVWSDQSGEKRIIDGVVLDIGVSSMQIDNAERGFSFMQDGPLDMRMGRTGPSAAEIVNTASQEELADIFYYYGEERHARSMARAIVADREKEAFVTTGQLASLASRIIRKEPGIHAATRIFQALRIAVNDELNQLLKALYAAERILKPGGRLVVVTFHSLEDRIVKQFIANRTGKGLPRSRHLPENEAILPTFQELTRKPVIAGDSEKAANPRARSAKLRAALRLNNPDQKEIPALDILAGLPAGEKNRGKQLYKTGKKR